MKTKRKILSLLLAVCLMVGLMPTMALAADGDVTYLYCDANGTNWQTGTKAAGEYTLVTSSDIAWGTAGETTWYAASGEIAINSRVTVSGTVNLILTDGCTLTVSGGIGVNNDNNFTVYAQSTVKSNTGTLVAKATNGWYAGIGGQDGTAYGNITINGGNVTANGNTSSAGIGAGHRAGGKTITINGGYVTATAPASTYEPAAISCSGSWGGAGSIIIRGGIIDATGCGKGIGWSTNARGEGLIEISGGVVTANGIGTGNYGEVLNNTYISENAVIISTGAVNSTNQPTWNGIVNYVMYGISVTPTDDFEIPSGKTLTIGNGQTLTVAKGVTLTNNGTIVIDEGGQLIVDGTLINSGEITNNGTITNNGDITGNGTLGGEGKVRNKVTISFDANGGSGIVGVVTAYTTDTYTLPECTFTAPTGKRFKGWATSADGSVITEKTISVSADTTLYAIWEKIPVKPTPPTAPEWVNPFTDVKETDWFYEAVKYVNENGLMMGNSQTAFDPNGTTTRAQAVTVLWRLEGEPICGQGKSGTFGDVPDYKWYTEAVEWAAACGIVGGYGDLQQSFGPNDPITREQLAAILWRYAKYKGYDVSASDDLSSFKDADTVSKYAIDAMKWAVAEGVIGGLPGRYLDPKGSAARAQTATVIMRAEKSL